MRALTISAPTAKPIDTFMPRKAIDRKQERTMEMLVAKHFTCEGRGEGGGGELPIPRHTRRHALENTSTATCRATII